MRHLPLVATSCYSFIHAAGLLSAMTISFPSAALFWTAYTGFKRRLQGDEPTSSPLSAAGSHAIAAGAADVMVCLIRNPFEVVKQQMQVGLHRTTREAVRSIVRLDGARGLYAGFWSTIARDIPFDACQFVMYEHLKGELMTYRGMPLPQPCSPPLLPVLVSIYNYKEVCNV